MSSYGSEEPRGRRATTLTPELVASLVTLIRHGASRSDACVTSGVCATTLANWRKKANQGQAIYIQALEEIDKAAVEWKLEQIRFIAESDDWKARAHLLARRYPKEWGKCKEESEFREMARRLEEKDAEIARLKEEQGKTTGPVMRVEFVQPMVQKE